MKVLKYPVFPLTFFFASGIITGKTFGLPISFCTVLFAVSLLCFSVLFFSAKNQDNSKTWTNFAALATTFIAGALAFAVHYPPNQSSHYSNFISPNESQVVRGYVTERIKPNEFNEKYYFKLLSANGKPVCGTILITVPKDSTGHYFYAGDILAIEGDLTPIPGAGNPYQFDYAAYMENQGIFHQFKLSKNYLRDGQLENPDYYIADIRERLANSFIIHQFSADTNNIVKALLFGQRQDIDAQTRDNYTDSGVIHILAISGLHVAILFYFFNLITKPLMRLGSKGRVITLVASLIFLWSFAVLAGLSASVVRAVVMFSFISVGQFLKRDAHIFNSIAVSMLLLLVVKPVFLFDIGFQLSYAAVFAIVRTQPLLNRIRRSKYLPINYVRDLVLISAVAQVGVLPVSLLYFNQFPLLFPLANIVVIPLATIALVLAVIVLALNFIWADIAVIFGRALGLVIDLMNQFTGWIASFKNLVIKDIPFTPMLMMLSYAMIISFVLWMFQKEFKRLAVALTAVMALQGTYTMTKLAADNQEEFVIFHNWEQTLLSEKHGGIVTFYTNGVDAAYNRNIKSYMTGTFSDSISILPIRNVYIHHNKKILVIDSTGVYPAQVSPDVLLLAQSPKINLERIIDSLSPKAVIADATNYKSYIKRWQQTCVKKKIPFHATAEKGSYIIR